jgi:hypothetical protein
MLNYPEVCSSLKNTSSHVFVEIKIFRNPAAIWIPAQQSNSEMELGKFEYDSVTMLSYKSEGYLDTKKI